MSRVVITAAESLCAAGKGRKQLMSALRRNVCLGVESQYSLPVKLVGRYLEPIPCLEHFVDDQKSLLGWECAQVAMKAANWSAQTDPMSKTAVFVGTGLSSITPYEMNEDLFGHVVDGAFDRAAMAKDLRRDLAAPKRHLPHHFGHLLGKSVNAVRAGSNFSACAAASQAIAAGFWSVRRGESTVAIVGGHDSMDHPMGLLSFLVLGALSPDECRPFDASRNGFMLGEGAGMLVLESYEHAVNRGAPILAEILGAGSSMDAWNPTAPHPEGAGAEMAMRRALKDANLSPSDVDYVNAHGTGTPLGDVAESSAIYRMYGDQVAVSSIKGAVGHCIAAAGAVEAVACVGMLEEGWMVGTAGLTEPDPACPSRNLSEPQLEAPNVIVSNSFGFGGQNASLVLCTPEFGEHHSIRQI
jgi:3-oxoacyl-(acyl-carrier-protein) synthase